MTKIITVEWLNEKDACRDAVDYARTRLNSGKPLSECIDQLERADWLLWLLWHAEVVSIRQLVWLACVAGRISLRHVPAGEDRPRLAYEAAEAWVRNPTDTAAEAAWAAGAAAEAAGAARAAEAAGAAGAAARAAEAAGAAGAAARAAARAAEAAGAAEHRAMCDLIRAELEKPEFRAWGNNG